MKQYFKNNWAMYSILAICLCFLLGTGLYLYQNRNTQKKSCSITDQQSVFTYTYTMEGNEDTVAHLTLTISAQSDRTLTEEETGTLAMQAAGNEISLLQSSEAVDVTFAFKKDTFYVWIDMIPSLFTSADYTYLNANGFYLIGTIDWNHANAEDLAAVLQADGYTCH